jgi:tyrosinase
VISSFTPTFELQKVLATSKEYDNYRGEIENPHGQVHVNIGGDMQSTLTSPNDPVFYLHHANVDRLWWKWQLAYPKLANTYAGSSFTSGKGMGTATVGDALAPYKARVSDVFRTEDLCYTYKEENLDNFKVKLPQPVVRGSPRTPGGDIDKSVKVGPAPVQTKPISSIDRSDLLHIRVPKPLPESWIKENGMNAEEVRAREKKRAEDINKANEKETVVDGALWTRPGALAKLISAGASKFHADVEGIRVEVKAIAQKPLQAVADLKERVKSALKKKGIDAKLPQT